MRTAVLHQHLKEMNHASLENETAILLNQGRICIRFKDIANQICIFFGVIFLGIVNEIV